jgi:catecholate siderophore receptor
MLVSRNCFGIHGLGKAGQGVTAVRVLLASAILLQAQAMPQWSLAADAVLPEVQVRERPVERADGPVNGYRATQSSTFTKTDTPLKEVPASISVVPAQLIKDQAMQGMADIFRYVPGAISAQGENNRDQVILRGISTSADFYLNGVRDDPQIFRDLYNAERVEVLKGPGGMIFGRGGAGGVVNRVTKKPTFGRTAEASVTAGSYDQLRTTLDYGTVINDKVAFRLNAMAETADSFRNGVDLKRFGINPTLAIVLSERTLLNLDFEHYRDGRTPDRGNPSLNGKPFLLGRSTFFGNADQSTSHSFVDGFSAILDHDFGSGVTLRNTFRSTRYDKFYQNVYPGSAVSGAGTLTLSAYNNNNERTNIFNQTDLVSKFSTGTLQHTLLAGVEVGHQNSDNKRNTGFFGANTSALVSAANPFAVATIFRPNGTDANNNVTSDITGVYLQDQITLSPQWKILAGVRYDRFEVDFDDRRTLVTATDLARTDTAYSPRGGLIWTPTAASTYYLNYSCAFLPSAEQLSLANGTVDLSPETAKNYEGGARWDLLPNLTLSAAVFRTDRNNVKVTDPTNPTLFVKTGLQRTQGIEVGLQGDVTDRWQVYGGYANLHGRVVNPLTTGTTPGATVAAGTKLPLVPNNTFSLWNKFNLLNGWAAGVGLVYQDESFASISNTVTISSFWRTDGAVYYTFAGGKTRVALNVENIFDRTYFPTVDGDNNITVGAPRNARLTLLTSF